MSIPRHDLTIDEETLRVRMLDARKFSNNVYWWPKYPWFESYKNSWESGKVSSFHANWWNVDKKQMMKDMPGVWMINSQGYCMRK